MGSRSSRRTLDPYDMPVVPHHRQNFNPSSKNHHLNSANFLRAQDQSPKKSLPMNDIAYNNLRSDPKITDPAELKK